MYLVSASRGRTADAGQPGTENVRVPGVIYVCSARLKIHFLPSSTPKVEVTVRSFLSHCEKSRWPSAILVSPCVDFLSLLLVSLSSKGKPSLETVKYFREWEGE